MAAKSKPWLLICWICRKFIVTHGQSVAEQACDLHGRAKHHKADWSGFMECELLDSAVETREVDAAEIRLGIDNTWSEIG